MARFSKKIKTSSVHEISYPSLHSSWDCISFFSRGRVRCPPPPFSPSGRKEELKGENMVSCAIGYSFLDLLHSVLRNKSTYFCFCVRLYYNLFPGSWLEGLYYNLFPGSWLEGLMLSLTRSSWGGFSCRAWTALPCPLQGTIDLISYV